jgi:acyl-CoA dehydrogenase
VQNVIGQLLSGPVEPLPCEGVAQWWPRYRDLAASCRDPFNCALACGFAADRIGWAFASGYQAALHALFPDAPDGCICALCVTEADGNSPKAIRSTLRRDGARWLLNGAKRWTTLGPDGALFYVAARDEAACGDRPAIRIAKIPSGCAGLTVQAMQQAAFVPEVPHARLHFENLVIHEADILEGDGYDRYVKPFRTAEDIHVNAAILAYVVREARRMAWPEHWLERTFPLLMVFQDLAKADPSAPQTHVVLAGALAIGAGLLAEADALWLKSPTDPAAGRWKRDRALFEVAAQARAMRTERAWQRLAPRRLVGRLPTP